MAKQAHRTVAVGTAALVLLGAGTIMRWVHVSRATAALISTPLTAPLSGLPEQIGRYALVQHLPLATDILDVADVDSFIQRDYVDTIAGRHLLLYVGYWGRENKGLGHGPEVCYPAVGWTPASPPGQRTVRFEGVGQAARAVMALHRFVRDEPEGTDRHAVGFTAIVSGEYSSSSRGMFQHRPRRLTGNTGNYLTHVQVSCSVPTDAWDEAESDIVAFMEALLPHLSRCLPGSGKRAE